MRLPPASGPAAPLAAVSAAAPTDAPRDSTTTLAALGAPDEKSAGKPAVAATAAPVIKKRVKLLAKKSSGAASASLASPKPTAMGSSSSSSAAKSSKVSPSSRSSKTPGTAASKQKKAGGLLSFFGAKSLSAKAKKPKPKSKAPTSAAAHAPSPTEDVVVAVPETAVSAMLPGTKASQGGANVAVSCHNANEDTPSSSEDSDSKNVEWVQCDRCKKWRTIPSHVEVASLPDKWLCSMNEWNPKYNSCYAKLEPGAASSSDLCAPPPAETFPEKEAAAAAPAAGAFATAPDASVNLGNTMGNTIVLGGIKVPAGWTFTIKPRKNGAAKDKEWKSADGLFKFRSKVAVNRHLALSEDELAALVAVSKVKKTRKRKAPTEGSLKPSTKFSKTALATFVTKAPPAAKTAKVYFIESHSAAQDQSSRGSSDVSLSPASDAIASEWASLSEEQQAPFLAKAKQDAERFALAQAAFEKQTKALYGDASLLSASPNSQAERLASPAVVLPNPHQDDLDTFEAKRFELIEEARALKSRLSLTPPSDEEILSALKVAGGDQADTALARLCSMSQRSLLTRLVQGSELNLQQLCVHVLKRLTGLKLAKSAALPPTTSGTALTAGSSSSAEMTGAPSATATAAALPSEPSTDKVLADAIRMVARRHCWGEKKSNALTEIDTAPTAVWSWEGADVDCLLLCTASASEKTAFKHKHRSVFRESGKLSLAIRAAAKVCRIAGNRRTAASSVSKAKDSFHGMMRALTKCRMEEQTKAEKRAKAERDREVANAAKLAKVLAAKAAREEKAAKLAAERMRKAEEKENAKQERLRKLAADKAARLAENERIAKEKAERKIAADAERAAKKAAEEAAKVGWRKAKTAYTFFVKAMMSNETLPDGEKNFKAIAARWKSVSDEEKAIYVAMQEEDKKRCEQERIDAIAAGTFIDRDLEKSVSRGSKKSSKPPLQKNNLFTMFGRKAPSPKLEASPSSSSVKTSNVSQSSPSSGPGRIVPRALSLASPSIDCSTAAIAAGAVPKKLSRAERRAAKEAAEKAKMEETTVRIDTACKDNHASTDDLFNSWCASMQRAAAISRKTKFESAPVLIADGPSAPKKRPRRKQLLQFSENERPPFWGVWSSKDTQSDSTSPSSCVTPVVRILGSACGYGSLVISGRRPFVRDTTKLVSGVVQYDYDSDEEWEGGEPGETLNSDVEHSDEDDDEELAALTAEERNAKEFDMNDGWMCADDVVVYSDDEEYSDAEELEDQNGTGPLNIDRVIAKNDNKRKSSSGGPDKNDPGGSGRDDDDDDDAPKHRRKIRRIKAQQEEADGINNGQMEMFSPMFFSELSSDDASASPDCPSGPLPLSASGTVLQSFRAVSLVSCPIDPNLFLTISNKRTSTELDDASHLPDLCSMVHLAKSLKQVVAEFQAVFAQVSTNNIREKVRAIATRNAKVAGVSGSCWCVKDDVLKMCGLDYESLQNSVTLTKAHASHGKNTPDGVIIPTVSAVQRMQMRLEEARAFARQEKAAAAAAVAEAELKKKEAESKRKARAAAKQKAAEEAEARQFRSELHLSTLLSLVHFTSDSKETIVELFHHSFPHVAKSQILRKIGECSSKKTFHGGQRWVVHGELLVQRELDRKNVMMDAAPDVTSSAPVLPSLLDDGTTELVPESPEGNAFLKKWFCDLSVEARMRFRFSEMDSCLAAAADEMNRKQATKLAKEQARMAREEAKKARIAEAEKKKREAEARKFRDEIHLSTLVSLVHFTSDSRETIIAHFHQLFPQISQLQISRKISSSATKKSYHGGRRWVVNDDCLAHTKLDRTAVKAKTDPASASSSSSSSSSSSTAAAGTAAVTPAAVPVPPLVLKDGITELVVGTHEGDACLWKWFCGLTTESRMRFRYSEMDANAAAAAAGAAVKKKKKRKGKLTMPVGWTAVQKVRATGNSAGQLDTVYHSPDGLTKCRSLLEIYRHLESQKNQATLNLAVPETTNKRKRSFSSGAMTAEKPVASDKNIPKKRKKLTALKSVE